MRHRGGMSLRCRSDVAFLHRSDLAGRLGGDIALRRRSDIAKRNHLGREGGRSDVAATFVKVAATSLRPKILTGRRPDFELFSQKLQMHFSWLLKQLEGFGA